MVALYFMSMDITAISIKVESTVNSLILELVVGLNLIDQ
jgi:hypothetical protein